MGKVEQTSQVQTPLGHVALGTEKTFTNTPKSSGNFTDNKGKETIER